MWTMLTVWDGASVGGGGGLVGLDVGEARKLNAIAALLEALALSVAPAFDAAGIAQLRSASNAFRSSAGDASSLAIADHDFHSRLVERCGDERLLATLAPVRESLYRLQARLTPYPDDVARAADEHDAIVDALSRGDHAAAAQRVREHVAGGLPGVLPELKIRDQHQGAP
jgi:GntR family transcriptional regulator, transcriptional repressor for pyruvate dehydrogenase complex